MKLEPKSEEEIIEYLRNLPVKEFLARREQLVRLITKCNGDSYSLQYVLITQKFPMKIKLQDSYVDVSKEEIEKAILELEKTKLDLLRNFAIMQKCFTSEVLKGLMA